MLDARGISPDPHKTEAVLKMAQPTTRTELRRFMGMVNQLSKFSNDIAYLSKPLRELLSSKQTWMWGPFQEDAFSKVKKELTHRKFLLCTIPKRQLKSVQTSLPVGWEQFLCKNAHLQRGNLLLMPPGP